MDLSRLGKPTDNGFIEAFESNLRAKSLNARGHRRSDKWRNDGDFTSFADACEKLENWHRHYNENVAHSAIGYNVGTAMYCPDCITYRYREQAEKILLPRSKVAEKCITFSGGLLPHCFD